MTEAEIRHTFAARLSAAMETNGFCARDVVQRSRTRIGFSNINSWKAGKCLPKSHRLAELAALLEVSVGWLLGAEESDEVRQG